jgi:hypothetical protein
MPLFLSLAMRRCVCATSGARDRLRDMRNAFGSNWAQASGVCTENLIRVDAVMESPKLAE